MKRRFILCMVVGVWLLCISACGKEEAVDGEALTAQSGSGSLEGGPGSGREDGAKTEKAEKASGEGQRVGGEDSDDEENLKNAGDLSRAEESEGAGAAPEKKSGCGKEGSEKSGAASEGEEGSGESGPASEGKEGSEKSGAASGGTDGRGESNPASGGTEGRGESGTGSQNGAVQTGTAGALSVDGARLVDGNGNTVQLKGISTHGLAWYPDYVNEDCIRQLKDEWGMNVFRLAMYTAEYGGYCSGGDKEDLKALVKEGVGYATENDMYVIIDWHILSDGNPNTYLEDAKDFFQEMSEEYADYTNVLYEICNEPNGGTSWSDVKSYAEQVIEVIRENDEDGIILVGTPNWSQYVEQAAEDPVEGYDNIMYTLHFYAATHKEDLRQAMVRAVEAGLPVFVSEYGICDASGSGGIDEYQADQWVQLLDQYQISYVAWNLSNKSETSAVIKSDCGKTSGFTQEDLSDSGKWLYGMLGAQGSLGADTGNAGQGTAGSGGQHGADTGNRGQEAAGSGGQHGTEAGNAGQEAAGSGGQHGTDTGNAGQEAAGSGGQHGSEAEGTGQGTAGNGGSTGQQGDLGLSVQLINSWGQGGDSFYQYTLTITNLGEADVESWTVQIAFNGDITLSNGWNGNCQVDGNTLVISSMDYNGHINKGGSAENVGFILQGQEGLAPNI